MLDAHLLHTHSLTRTWLSSLTHSLTLFHPLTHSLVVPLQIHPCLTMAACTRSDQTRSFLTTWSQETAGTPTSQLNITPYMSDMCSDGYQGPICGSCSSGHGRLGRGCVQCMAPAANTVLYIMLCFYMFLLIALGGCVVSTTPM